MMVRLIIVALVLQLTAEAQSEDQPADCVQYEISDIPRKTATKSFETQVRLGLDVPYVNESWKVELLIKSPSTGHSCSAVFNVTAKNDKNDKGVIAYRCSAWEQKEDTIVQETKLVNLYGWRHFDLFFTENKDVLLTSIGAQDVEIITLRNTGLTGKLQAQWLPNRKSFHVNFDCYSGCHLRSGDEYQSTYGDQFFAWCGSPEELIFFKAFPSSYNYLFTLQDEDSPVQAAGKWTEVVVDQEHRSINWTVLGTRSSYSVLWTAGHVHSYFDVKKHLTVHVPRTCLVTNCHPYQLPCRDDPFKCESVELWTNNHYVAKLLTSWQLTIEWIVLAAMLLIILFLLVSICCLKKKLRKFEMGDTPGLEMEKRRPSRGKNPRFGEENSIYDEFSSDHVYEIPNELRAKGNVYSNNGGGQRESRISRLYSNILPGINRR
ncbi:uncharacterized protein LOC108666047 [Hyalella azteca]|uniref:Uncharacterized protein LOC108666047 n=1 Tax=Hyalella azteca TaxID=294128 RepID=A0A8B7N3B2_HYAAZ|nr:uncharacterized protein LOC108666047 [Hyalella azteca]